MKANENENNIMKKDIVIQKSPTADTRSSDHMVSTQELKQSTSMHRKDVYKAMKWLANKVEDAGVKHDWTKVEYFREFYKQFHKAQETGKWGKGWYNEIHVVSERHHLVDRIPDDVDLIDVLEQIADGVMAGLARNGKYVQRKLPEGLLEKAYANTVKKLIDATEVE